MLIKIKQHSFGSVGLAASSLPAFLPSTIFPIHQAHRLNHPHQRPNRSLY